MKIPIDVRRNSDGTVTAVYGKYRESFTVNEWDTEAEIFDKARWLLISGGAQISEETVREVHNDQEAR